MTLLEKMDGETMDAFDECCCCSEFGGLFLVSCFVVPMEPRDEWNEVRHRAHRSRRTLMGDAWYL